MNFSSLRHPKVNGINVNINSNVVVDPLDETKLTVNCDPPGCRKKEIFPRYIFKLFGYKMRQVG